ncbi:MAG: energy transducer TonB [bacterium]
MVANRSLNTFMIISLLLHALVICLIPKFKPVETEERIGGSYTQVQLIQVPLQAQAPDNRNVSRPVDRNAPSAPKPQNSIPLPEMDPAVRNQMRADHEVPMPSFDLPRPLKAQVQPLSYSDADLEDDIIDRALGDELLDQQKRTVPATQVPPQPGEIASKRKENQPKPVPEEMDFDQVEPVEKVSRASTPSAASDIQWSGKPRNLIAKPDYPLRYPEGYQGQTQGRIRLKFWVDSQGYVIRVVPMQKLDPRLEAVASDYLRQYRFEPVSKGKGSEHEWGIIPFSFRLE